MKNLLTASALLAMLTLSGRTQADIITSQFGSGTPDNSWAYSRAVGVGRGNSTTYVPRKEHAVGLAFEGYVSYPGGDGWIHTEPSLYNEDTVRLFRTYVLSETDLSISVRLGADDGHAIYLDDTFLGGGGFGVPVEATIPLTAGVPAKLELLGYNGPGPWQVVFRRQDGSEVADTPGLRFNAEGNFAPVPELGTLTVLGAGIGMLIISGRYRMRANRRRLLP